VGSTFDFIFETTQTSTAIQDVTSILQALGSVTVVGPSNPMTTGLPIGDELHLQKWESDLAVLEMQITMMSLHFHVLPGLDACLLTGYLSALMYYADHQSPPPFRQTVTDLYDALNATKALGFVGLPREFAMNYLKGDVDFEPAAHGSLLLFAAGNTPITSQIPPANAWTSPAPTGGETDRGYHLFA